SQEFAADYGDYYRADGARLTYRHGSGVRGEWSAALGREWIRSLAVTAQPASGGFRPNPALGDVGLALVQLALRRRSEGFAVRRTSSPSRRTWPRAGPTGRCRARHGQRPLGPV